LKAPQKYALLIALTPPVQIDVKCLVGALLLARLVAAEGPAAEQRFVEARALMKQRRYAEACPLLEQSYAMEPAVGTLLNIADCFENIGRTASALRAFLDVAADAASRHDERREREALERADALRPRLSLVELRHGQVPPLAAAQLRPANAPGAAPLRTWSLDAAAQAVPLDPGRYLLVLSAPGHRRQEVVLEVPREPGSRIIELPPLLAEASPPVGVPEAPQRRSPIAVAALAAGAGLTSAALVGVAWSRSDPAGGRYAAEAAQALQPVSWVGLGVGLVALAAGLYLFVRATPATLSLALSVSPGGMLAGLRGSL
jgi:hypothetical protein